MAFVKLLMKTNKNIKQQYNLDVYYPSCILINLSLTSLKIVSAIIHLLNNSTDIPKGQSNV